MAEIVIIKTDEAVVQTSSEKELYYEKLKDVLSLDDSQVYLLKNFTYKKPSIDKLDEINIKNLLDYKNFETILIVDKDSFLKVQFPEQVKYINKTDLSYYLARKDENFIYTEAPNLNLNIIGIMVPLSISHHSMMKKMEKMEGGAYLDDSIKAQVLKKTAHIDYFYHKIFADIIEKIVVHNLDFMNSDGTQGYVIFKDKTHAKLVISLLLELNFWLEVCKFPAFIEFLLNKCIKEDTSYDVLNIFEDFRENIVPTDSRVEDGPMTKFLRQFEDAYDQKLYEISLRNDMATNKLLNEYYLLKVEEKAKLDKCDSVLVKHSMQEQDLKLRDQFLKEVIRKMGFRALFKEKYEKIFKNLFGYFPANIYRNLEFGTDKFLSADELSLIDKFTSGIKDKEVKPWDRIIDNIRENRNKQRNLELLETFIKNKDGDDFKTESGDVVICAHLYKVFHGEDKLKILEYAANTIVENLYFCRNCGEEIAKKEFKPKIGWEGNRELGQHHVDDEITLQVLKYVIGILKSEVLFRQEPPDGHFTKMAKTITTCLLPDVKSVNKQLHMDKMITNEQRENELRLFTVIYIYALLAKIVMDNLDDVKFKFYGEYSARYKVKDLLDNVARIIITRQNITINKIERIKAKDIRDYVQAAFDELSNRLVSQVKKLNVQSREYKLNDPIVQYLSYRFKDMQKEKDILNEVSFSKSYAFYNVDFKIAENPEDTLFIFTKYLSLNHNSTPINQDGEHLGYYKEYLNFFDIYLKFEQEQNFLKSTFRKKKWLASKVIHQRQFLPLEASLDDFLVNPHVDELLSLNFSFKGGFHKHIFKGKKCIKCETPYGTITNEKGLKDAVYKYKNVDNFYNFYFNQCLQPKEGHIFHEFVGNKCSQCGIEKIFIINRDIGFFEKNYSKFEQSHTKKMIEFKKKEPKPFIMKNKTVFKENPMIYNIFLDKTMTAFLAGPSLKLDKSPITKKDDYVNFWKFVGLFQINEFQFKEINKNPHVRAQWLNYYIELIIKKYLAAMNYKNIKILNDDLKKIMDAYGLSFPKLSPNNFNGFLLKKPFGLSAEETEKYYYESLLNLLIEISDKIKNNDFMYYILNIIIKSEKEISLPSEMDRLRLTSEFQDAVVINEMEDIAEDDVYKNMDYDGENEEGAT